MNITIIYEYNMAVYYITIQLLKDAFVSTTVYKQFSAWPLGGAKYSRQTVLTEDWSSVLCNHAVVLQGKLL